MGIVEYGIRVDDQDFRPDRHDLKLGLKLALRVINNRRLLGLFKCFAFLDSLQENGGSRDGILGSKDNSRLVSWSAANLLILCRNHLPWAGTVPRNTTFPSTVPPSVTLVSS